MMKKVAIVGVEGSGKTVMLAGLGDLYAHPDPRGYFLTPKNFSTASYVVEKIAGMRNGIWPSATADDVLQHLHWHLRRKTRAAAQPEDVCEIACLDFAGEVYRSAFGIVSRDNPAHAREIVELKDYVRSADEIAILINLRDVITRTLTDPRVREAVWITRSILESVFAERASEDFPRVALVLTQADNYGETIRACGGAKGALERYLPDVANNYGWIDVLSVHAVDKTVLDDEGTVRPAPDFTTQGLAPLVEWITGASAQTPSVEKEDRVSLEFGSYRIHFLSSPVITFGRRKESNDIALRPVPGASELVRMPYRKVSREHCTFDRVGSRVILSDGRQSPLGLRLPSTGGTFWQDEPVCDSVELPVNSTGTVSFGGREGEGALSMDVKVCPPVEGCDGEQNPSLILLRRDGIREAFVGLWGSLRLREIDPSLEDVVIFFADGAFACRFPDGRTTRIA